MADGGVVFRGGMPYAPDVNKLKETFPVSSLTEGRVIAHAEFEAVTGYKKGHSRFYNVVNAWITSQKNEVGIFLAWDQGKGVRVLRPHEINALGEKRSREKIGQVGRALKIFTHVPRERLDGIGQQRLDHNILWAAKVKQDLVSNIKALPIELAPVKSLPKPMLMKTG